MVVSKQTIKNVSASKGATQQGGSPDTIFSNKSVLFNTQSDRQHSFQEPMPVCQTDTIFQGGPQFALYRTQTLRKKIYIFSRKKPLSVQTEIIFPGTLPIRLLLSHFS